ncbi:MAG: hypothetical protein WA718_12370 [Terriglobales bacterium]
MTRNVLWRDLYAGAMLELDRARLQKRIQNAEAAIQQALADQRNADNGRDVEELQAMTDAIRNLETLRRLELSAPIGIADQGHCSAKETL